MCLEEGTEDGGRGKTVVPTSATTSGAAAATATATATARKNGSVTRAELIIVRHGETTWNASGVLQGQAESDLNDTGRKQAHAVADRLVREGVNVTAVYSSDLNRAFETAEVIASKCGCAKVVAALGLRERHLGKLQGLERRRAHIIEPKAFQAFTSSSKDEPIPGGGESLNQLYERSKQTIEDIAQKHLGQQIVVVTHGGVLRALHIHAMGKSASGRVLNASINIFKISDKNEWSLCSWGDVKHLQIAGFFNSRLVGDQDSA